MTNSWQKDLRDAITCPDSLRHSAGLTEQHLNEAALKSFSLKVPKAFLSRITPGDPTDPLLLQVLPQKQELVQKAGYTQDPLSEAQFNKLPGLIHKYKNRVLLILTGACAVNCRYCFRRNFPYSENRLSTSQLENIIDYIRQDTNICEVILSGGDPLILKDKPLQSLINKLESIEHLSYLRLHTRLPIMIPARVTTDLVNTFKGSRLCGSVVIHCNHPQEIDADVSLALRLLKSAGIQLLNQSVLLRNINDNASVLIKLSHKLYSAGVLPYYLHMLDPVTGTQHFNVEKKAALKLMAKLQASLPGYLVPRLVRELAGEPNKTYVS